MEDKNKTVAKEAVKPKKEKKPKAGEEEAGEEE